MKPTVKIILLLSAVILIASLGMWVWRSSPKRHDLAETPHQTTRTNVSPPVTRVVNAGPAAPTPVTAPESVRSIVKDVTSATFAERVKAVHALPVDLSTDEINAFHAYLLSPAESGGENREQENWLRNEMMDKLTEPSSLPAGLAQVLVSIYQDPTHDIVMRDYAVQHMSPVYTRANEEDKATLLKTLWQAVAESDSSIAGTALLALRDLSQDHREVEQNKLGAVALKIAGDDQCGELSRITALQICGRMGLNQAAPLIMQLVQKPGSVPLQIAAIAALGDVGNEQARNYLQQLAVQSELRLLPALQAALKKMNERLGI